jgi:hypothetical protein
MTPPANPPCAVAGSLSTQVEQFGPISCYVFAMTGRPRHDDPSPEALRKREQRARQAALIDPEIRRHMMVRRAQAREERNRNPSPVTIAKATMHTTLLDVLRRAMNMGEEPQPMPPPLPTPKPLFDRSRHPDH